MQKYVKSPLPFLGQKRNWLKTLREQDLAGKTVVDLFGGSGLVSHTIKEANPTARVIWNDYDHFIIRLMRIGETELLRQKLRAFNLPVRKRIGEEEKAKMAKVILEHKEEFGGVDWITLSSWLLYSGNYAHDYEDLVRRGWYYSVIKSELDATGYLTGVERVSKDFRELFAEYADDPDAVFIADPPYIMTNQTGYVPNSGEHFRLKDAVQLIQLLYERRALLFSSPKSETDSLLEVFVPETLSQEDFATSIGRTRVRETLYFINW